MSGIMRLPVGNFTNSGLCQGTNAGVKATVTGVSGKQLQFVRLSGYSDTASLLELRTVMTGTIATDGSTTAVIGTNTSFTTEFSPGDIIRGGTNDEAIKILSITNNTNIVATANTANNVASQAIEKVIEVFSCLINQSVGQVTGANLEIVNGITGKAIVAKLMTSTSLCKLTLYGGYTS